MNIDEIDTNNDTSYRHVNLEPKEYDKHKIPGTCRKHTYRNTSTFSLFAAPPCS